MPLEVTMSDPAASSIIEIRVKEVAQLFNSFDPSPFNERDLDGDAEAHIVGYAQALPTDRPLRIVVYVPAAEAERCETAALATAFANFFMYRAGMIDRDLKELLRVGRRALVIGMVVLSACLVASQVAETRIAAGPVQRIVAESFVILGWVANWKPLETFLYDWWPIARQRNLYRRLAKAGVEVRAG
jgi:hypothetical protein